ncbi:MAG: hypothetical protein HUJ91_07140, partial [Bacteroidales bacterium]|nr:hypothetical protein [Bacteroidales bacterium]
MKLFARICLTAALVVSPFAILEAQSARTLVSRGDQARQEYDFSSAIQHYQSALSRSEDEQERLSISEKITQCENGQSMLEYSSRPEVISTITVPRSDFFLYYSHFADRAWKKGENGQAILFDSGDNTLVMPLRGEDGHFDLYSASRQGDGGWSPLENLGPNVNSAGDEVFATLADGGKRLYFSSNGLSGMGGYDIFVSEWD